MEGRFLFSLSRWPSHDLEGRELSLHDDRIRASAVGSAFFTATSDHLSQGGRNKGLLFYFSIDRHPNPFDILFAHDAGFDIVRTFSGVEMDEIKALVQDAMFPPRAERGEIPHTHALLRGRNLDAVEEMAEKARKTMFAPFQPSVAFHPKGAHTPSSAFAAKVMKTGRTKGERFEGQKGDGATVNWARRQNSG